MPLCRDTIHLSVGERHAERGRERRGQHLYPVVDDAGNLTGVLTRRDLLGGSSDTAFSSHMDGSTTRHVSELIVSSPVVAYPDEPLRVVVYRMAETGLTQFPVVERSDSRKLVGTVSLRDLLRARERNWAEERERERIIRVRLLPWLRSRQREMAEVG
jgi:CIC family chloride channel protein